MNQDDDDKNNNDEAALVDSLFSPGGLLDPDTDSNNNNNNNCTDDDDAVNTVDVTTTPCFGPFGHHHHHHHQPADSIDPFPFGDFFIPTTTTPPTMPALPKSSSWTNRNNDHVVVVDHKDLLLSSSTTSFGEPSIGGDLILRPHQPLPTVESGVSPFITTDTLVPVVTDGSMDVMLRHHWHRDNDDERYVNPSTTTTTTTTFVHPPNSSSSLPNYLSAAAPILNGNTKSELITDATQQQQQWFSRPVAAVFSDTNSIPYSQPPVTQPLTPPTLDEDVVQLRCRQQERNLLACSLQHVETMGSSDDGLHRAIHQVDDLVNDDDDDDDKNAAFISAKHSASAEKALTLGNDDGDEPTFSIPLLGVHNDDDNGHDDDSDRSSVSTTSSLSTTSRVSESDQNNNDEDGDDDDDEDEELELPIVPSIVTTTASKRNKKKKKKHHREHQHNNHHKDDHKDDQNDEEIFHDRNGDNDDAVVKAELINPPTREENEGEEEDGVKKSPDPVVLVDQQPPRTTSTLPAPQEKTMRNNANHSWSCAVARVVRYVWWKVAVGGDNVMAHEVFSNQFCAAAAAAAATAMAVESPAPVVTQRHSQPPATLSLQEKLPKEEDVQLMGKYMRGMYELSQWMLQVGATCWRIVGKGFLLSAVLVIAQALTLLYSLLYHLCLESLLELKENPDSIACFAVFYLAPGFCSMLMDLVNLPYWAPHVLSTVMISSLCYPPVNFVTTVLLVPSAGTVATTNNKISSANEAIVPKGQKDNVGNDSPWCPVHVKLRQPSKQQPLTATILWMTRLAVTFFFFYDGFALERVRLLRRNAMTRLLLASLLTLVRNDMILSPIGWVSWSIQVVVAQCLRTTLASECLVTMISLASLRYIRSMRNSEPS